MSHYMTVRKRLNISQLLVILLLAGCGDDTATRLYQQTSNYNFEDTMINIDIAVSEHNYRIIHRSNIGQAIRDRGNEDYPLSTVISFCNIKYAKEMMEINSNLINDMPCIITVREQQQGVIVGTQLMVANTNNPRQNKFAERVNNNLISIVNDTVE